MSSILVIVLTGTYLVLCGLRAVAFTETLQAIILVLGSILSMIFGLKAPGSWGPLQEIHGREMFNLWRLVVQSKPVF